MPVSIQSILNDLTGDLPLLSNLGVHVSLVDIMRDLGYGGAANFIDSVANVDNLITAILGIGSGTFDLGSFRLSGTSLSTASITQTQPGSPSSLATLEANVANAENVAASTGETLTLPILQSTTQTIQSFLEGNNPTLVSFAMPDFDFDVPYDNFVQVYGPLGVEFTGDIGIDIKLAVGMDTLGIQAATPFNTSKITQCFYIADSSQVKVSGEISAGVGLGVDLDDVASAEVDVSGGIEADVILSPYGADVQGKMRLLAGGSSFKFDTSGEIDASLFFHASAQVLGFTVWSYSYNLASWKLLDFNSATSTPQSPVLATPLGNGVLQLNYGANASDRQYGDIPTNNPDETFEVSPVEGTPGAVTVTASVNGTDLGTQQYTGVTLIVGNGAGDGNDSITIDPGVTAAVSLQAGNGDDTLQGGSGPTTLVGGSGNDLLEAGSGNTTIYGGKGSSTLLGGTGNDVMYASNASFTNYGGSVYIQGGSGNNTLYGSGGYDTLIGGSGGSVIYGEGGHDLIYGGISATGGNNPADGDLIYGDSPNQTMGGNDTIFSGDGPDTIYGGSGGNSITALGGNDLIYGGAGSNTIQGGSGNDTIYGGSGSYSINCGLGDDVIYGNGGSGTIHGGSGNDVINCASATSSVQIYGDSGSDTITGSNHGDTIYGGSGGSNVIYGGSGGNVIYGGGSGDLLYGGDGSNTIYGGPGSETLCGGAGTDVPSVPPLGPISSYSTATGSPASRGSNLLVGGSGPDMIYGDSSGHNTLEAGAGNDTLYAGTAGDYLAAGAGVDALYGGPGNDSFQLLFSPAGHQQPDTIVGGAGFNTLVLEAGAVDGSLAAGVTNFDLYLTHTAGTTDQYQALLYNLNSLQQNPNAAPIGLVNFSVPPDVEQVALEGGPGNNLIQVDRSVTRDMFLYGGPGNNTLIGGSGNDTLVGEPGNSVLWGGPGDSILYGGDLPSQDGVQYVSGTLTSNPQATGNSTLIAGSGNDELYAGDGNDVLIGGSAVLGQSQWSPGTGHIVAIPSSGQYQLIPGAGRDYLVGGAGNDLLISGTGQPGAILDAGSGNATLAADNFGMNYLQGGSGAQNLLVGGDLQNVIVAGSGTDTLVGGNNPGQWAAVQSAALASNVSLLPPSNVVPWDPNVEGLIQTLLSDQYTQPSGLTLSQQEHLAGLFLTVVNDLFAVEQSITQQLDAVLTLETVQGITPALYAQQVFLADQSFALATEQQYVDKQLGAQGFVDSLVGGAGNDTFYGSPDGSPSGSWLVGGTPSGSGNDASFNKFYYNPNDTIAGALGKDNILMLQGDGNIDLQHVVVNNGQDAVSVTMNGATRGAGQYRKCRWHQCRGRAVRQRQRRHDYRELRAMDGHEFVRAVRQRLGCGQCHQF